MNYLKTTFLQMFFVLLTTLIFNPCEAQKQPKRNKKPKADQSILKGQDETAKHSNTNIDCDPNLWKYVYNPERLQVIDKCKTVTGVIEESSANEDGDHHMLLKLDAGQDELLTVKNKKKSKATW